MWYSIMVANTFLTVNFSLCNVTFALHFDTSLNSNVCSFHLIRNFDKKVIPLMGLYNLYFYYIPLLTIVVHFKKEECI